MYVTKERHATLNSTLVCLNTADANVMHGKKTKTAHPLTCPFIRSSGNVSVFIFTSLIAMGFPVRRSEETSNSTSSAKQLKS